MTTRLLRPTWLVLHVLLAVAVVAMVKLGLWQWSRGVATGSIRNYSYGLEWYAFAALSTAGWVKFCWDETHEDPEPEPEPAAQPVAPALPVAQPVSEDEDPELAAWNARFAELARRSDERTP